MTISVISVISSYRTVQHTVKGYLDHLEAAWRWLGHEPHEDENVRQTVLSFPRRMCQGSVRRATWQYSSRRRRGRSRRVWWWWRRPKRTVTPAPSSPTSLTPRTLSMLTSLSFSKSEKTFVVHIHVTNRIKTPSDHTVRQLDYLAFVHLDARWSNEEK